MFLACKKRKRTIFSNLLTLEKKLKTGTYQVFPANMRKKISIKSSILRNFFRYRFRYRYVQSFGIGFGSYVADTEIADISVSAEILVSVVH